MHQIEEKVSDEERSVEEVPTLVDQDMDCYDHPDASEVAIIFETKDGGVPSDRDILIYPEFEKFQHLNVFSKFYDPMTYPILFPRGEPGWHPDLKSVGTN